MRNITLALIITVLVSACNYIGAGTLGGFEPIKFETEKKTLRIGVDSLYKLHPEYTIPEKWEEFDNWSERGFDFLEGRILYFSSSPEEMYYVTILGGHETRIAIRAVHTGNNGWLYMNFRHLRRKEL